MYANNVPEMKHMIEGGIPYVWLQHSKISEDLPILGYSEGTLRNKLLDLKKRGFINSISVPDTNGSKTFYCITELTMSLINDTGCHAKVTPNNNIIYNKNKDIVSKDTISDTTPDIVSPEKTKRKNLFQKCIDMIHEYTNETKLQDALVQYLELMLEKARTECKPLYANQFKGMLNKLDELVANGDGTHLDIVNQSIMKSYVGFFPANKNVKSNYQPDTNKAPQHLAGEKAKNEDGTLMRY